MSNRLAALGSALALCVLAVPADAGQVSALVTVTPHATAGFTAPIFTFSNTSDPGYLISNVRITGGFIDFIYGPALSPPITAPAGGTYTAINGTQVANGDVNDGCNAVDFNLTSFDSGDTFSFLADPEPNSCTSAVYDFRQRLDPTSSVFGFVSFAGPGISGILELSGNDWIKGLTNPNGADVEDNQFYQLTLRQTIQSQTGVPEPATLGLLAAGLAGLGAARRARKSKA